MYHYSVIISSLFARLLTHILLISHRVSHLHHNPLHSALNSRARKSHLLEIRRAQPSDRIPPNSCRKSASSNLGAPCSLSTSDIRVRFSCFAIQPRIQETKWCKTVGNTVAVQQGNNSLQSKPAI